MNSLLKKTKEGVLEVDLDDHTSVDSVLKYLYSGKCTVNQKNIHKIIKAADVFGIETLKSSCFDYLVSTLDKNTVSLMIMRARRNEFSFNTDGLIKSCLKFVEENTSDVFETEGFRLFDEKVILDLVQCENLTIEETDLFKAIYGWGENYIKDKRTDKNIVELLKDIMKFIRYPLIDAYDLKFYCRPTNLVPNNLYIDALEYNGRPNNFAGNNSKQFEPRGSLFVGGSILDKKQRIDLIKLIPKTYTKKPWKLLYSGSNDGYSSSTFHGKCDNSGGQTVVVIKSTNGNIFGGFTSKDWSSNGSYTSDKDAFLFSIKNSKNNVFKFPIHNNANGLNSTFYNNSTYGPTFGILFLYL
jgi:hypothetical protein